MKAFKIRLVQLLDFCIVCLLASCNLPSNEPIATVQPLPTFIQPTPVLIPTTTLPPTATLQATVRPIDTSTPIPCNRAEFISDVTIPDGTQVSQGMTFIKTWRIRNNGSCTWNSNYTLLFDHGERMNAPLVQLLASSPVAPGEIIEISVTLQSPSTPGTYQVDFRLRSSENQLFGIGPSGLGTFWVKIIVPQATAVATNTIPSPDFDRVILYGGGGGGGPGGIGYCQAYEQEHSMSGPSIFGISATVMAYYSERVGAICFLGIKADSPISVQIISPDGQIVLGGKFSPDHGRLNWEGYTDEEIEFFGSVEKDHSVNGQLTIWWPVGLPFGQWRITAEREGLHVHGDFFVPSEDSDLMINRHQEIGIRDSRADTKIIPAAPESEFLAESHQVRTNANGELQATGAGYDPNSVVYVLLYRHISRVGENGIPWGLVYTKGVIADNKGRLSIVLPNVFLPGDKFLIVSLSDPASLVGDKESKPLNMSAEGIGYEYFYIKP